MFVIDWGYKNGINIFVCSREKEKKNPSSGAFVEPVKRGQLHPKDSHPQGTEHDMGQMYLSPRGAEKGLSTGIQIKGAKS